MKSEERYKISKQVVGISGGMILLYFISGGPIPLIVALSFILLYFTSEIYAMKLMKFLSYAIHHIGKFLSISVLSLLFFLILTPVAILWRIFTKNPLNLKRGEKSYYVIRNKEFTIHDFQKPY